MLHYTLEELKKAGQQTSIIETQVGDIDSQQRNDRMLTQDLINEAVAAVQLEDAEPVIDQEAKALAGTALAEANTVSEQADVLSDIISRLEAQVELLQAQQQDLASMGTQTDEQETLITDLTGQVKTLQDKLAATESTLQDLDDEHVQLTVQYSALDQVHTRQTDAMLGNMTLAETEGAEDVSAAALNAAAEGAFTKTFEVMLAATHDAVDYPHTWAGFEPVVSSAEAVAEAAVAAPTAEDTHQPANDIVFRDGIAYITVIFDTDAGATKTYVNGESVTVTIKVNATDTVAGWTVAELVKTYNVIA